MDELACATCPPVALVVDDDPLVRRCLARFLESAGVVVLTAGDGRDAMRLLQRPGPRPDVVFTDLSMPVLDGAALIEQMERVPRLAGVPVIVVSASDEPCRGAAARLEKPFTRGDVLRAVAALTGR